MEIRIDTKKDSAEDIKKTINFLKSLVDMSSESHEINATSDMISGMTNIFGDAPVLNDDDSKPLKIDEDEDEEEEKDKNDKIEIIPY